MKKKGFALLIAVIFVAVMLAFGLALSALSYKQAVLSSGSVGSQRAFYAADAGMECVLSADQQQGLFAYPATDPGSAPGVTCDGTAVGGTERYSSSVWTLSYRLPLDGNAYCADVSVYKYAAPQPPSNLITKIYAQGYDVSCAAVNAGTARFSSRGLKIRY